MWLYYKGLGLGLALALALSHGGGMGSEFSQIQIITDTLIATYQHTIFSTVANFVGNFTCRLQDTDGNADERILI